MYDSGVEAMEGAAATVFLGMLVTFYLLMIGSMIVCYVFDAVGVYRIAKRRGIHHPWLAWIPVGNSWLLGSISDHYQYVAKQKVTKRRVILLVLGIVTAVMGGFFGLGTGLLSAAEIAGGEAAGSILAVVVMVIAYLGMMGLAITATIFCYIAYFDLFRSCKPKYDVLFLVLGIIFNVTLPFFVFACSGSDEGMPARRAPQPPVQIPCEPEAPKENPVEEPEIAVSTEETIPVVETEVVEDA